MNQNYKTIFSRIHQCFVVVSELTKSHGKGSRASRVLCTVLLGACLAGVGQPAAWGATATNASVNTTESSGNASSAWGKNTSATGASSTAWGNSTTASGEASTAFGRYTTASGVEATAWGFRTTASGEDATAWGVGTTASGDRATSWGVDTEASGWNSTTWGTDTVATGGDDATAWGWGSKASNEEATAWGYFSEASGRRATAWGYETKAEGDYATTWGSATQATGKRSTAWGHETTAGGENATSWGVSTTASGKNSTAFGSVATASGHTATAWGFQTEASGRRATAWGSQSEASGEASTAFGDSSKAEADNSLAALGGNVAAGADNSAAIGKDAKAAVADTVALGSGSVASREAGADDAYLKGGNSGNAWVSTHNAIAVGDDDTVTRQITGVAAGSKDTDAVNVAQLKEVASNAGSAITFKGDTGSSIEKPKEVNIIGGITDESALSTEDNIGVIATKNSNGGELKVRLAKDINLGKDGSVTTGNTRMDGNGLTIKGGPSVTQSGIDAGGKKITNVANGTDAKDAVNVSQLNDATQQQENNFRRLMHKDAQLERKIHRTGAHAAALAALHPLDFDEDHKLTASAGVGQYHGSNAVAAGVFYRPDENKMFSLGVSLNESDSMVNAGFSYRFGTGSGNKTSPNNLHEMRRQISTLSEENRQLSAQLNSSESRLASADQKIASSDAEIKELKERIRLIEKMLKVKTR